MNGGTPEVSNYLKQIAGLEDHAGRQSRNTIFGGGVSSDRIDDIAIAFNYNISDRDVRTEEPGSASVSVNNNMAVVSAGSDDNVTATLASLDNIRYRPGHDIYALFTARFDEPRPNTRQRAGFFDDENGHYFGFEEKEFGVTRRDRGTDNFTKQEEFSIDQLDGTGHSGFDLDHQKLNIFRINLGWLGVAPIMWEIYTGKENGWQTFHVTDLINNRETPESGVPGMEFRSKVINEGNSNINDLTLGHGSVVAGGIKSVDTDPAARGFNNSESVSISSDTKTPLFTLQMKDTFQGENNILQAVIEYISAGADGNKTVEFAIIEDATLSGTNFSDFDTPNSVMEIDTSATSISGGREMFSFQVSKTGSETIRLPSHAESGSIQWKDNKIPITFTALSSNSSDVRFTCKWTELF